MTNVNPAVKQLGSRSVPDLFVKFIGATPGQCVMFFLSASKRCEAKLKEEKVHWLQGKGWLAPHVQLAWWFGGAVVPHFSHRIAVATQPAANTARGRTYASGVNVVSCIMMKAGKA